MGTIDTITGASPRAAFVGRPVALWIWGEGIAEGAQVSFDNPGISQLHLSSRSLSLELLRYTEFSASESECSAWTDHCNHYKPKWQLANRARFIRTFTR